MGNGPDALPAVDEVPLSIPNRLGIGARVGLGYGLTESVLGSSDTHHRTEMDLAASVTPMPWFAAALRMMGRYDKHVGAPDDGDYGVITETHLTARADGAVGSSFRLGSELALWLPGSNKIGDSPAALSGDLQLLGTFVPENSPLTLGVALGLRVDRSKHSGGNPSLYSLSDRLALGASDSALAARLGLGLSYRLGKLDLLAEWSWKVYFDYVGESPMWLRGGARYKPARLWSFEALFGVSPSKRPPLDVAAPLAVVEPRVAASLAAILDFPWESPDTSDDELRARLDAERTREPTQAVLRGRVQAPSAAGVAGALLTLTRDSQSQDVTSDSEGAFVVESLPPGEYRVAIMAAGWIAQETVVKLAAGDNPELRVTLKRELPKGQIRGTVRQFNGNPVAASISISSLQIQQQNAKDGAFEINVPPGEYEVQVRARGFKSQTRRARVEEDGVAILIVELEPNKKR